MELIVKTQGELTIKENVSEYAEHFKSMMTLQKASNMQTDADFEKGNNFIKQLKETQDKIKTAKDSLVNGKAEEVMKILDDLNAEIAKKKTEFKKEIDSRKDKIKYDIIVEAQQKYAHECNNSNYKPQILKECEEAFKGKSSFENMQKDADIICNKYTNQYEQDEKKIAEMTVAYRAVNFIYNKDVRADLIALAVETYFKQGKDADFVRRDLSNKYMEEEAEKKRLEEEQRQKEENEAEQVKTNDSKENWFQDEDIYPKTGEILGVKLQETLDNKESESYNNSVEIPKKDTYFLVKYKQIKDETQIVIYAGLNKENTEKCGNLVFLNEEFIDFKALFPANDYVDLNNNNGEMQ
jgi:hypothetical protein